MYCANCGTQNQENTQFCENCGTKLNNAKQPVSNLNDDEQLKKIADSEKKEIREIFHLDPAKQLKKIADSEEKYIREMIYVAPAKLVTIYRLLLYFTNQNLFISFEARNPDFTVIPYQDIINLHLPKKGMFLSPKIRIETTSQDYEFYAIEISRKKYKRYLKTIPSILGDKVTIG